MSNGNNFTVFLKRQLTSATYETFNLKNIICFKKSISQCWGFSAKFWRFDLLMEKEVSAICKLTDFLERKKTVNRYLNIFSWLKPIDACVCCHCNLGYAIQKIVLVLVRALRAVRLWQCSLCNITTVLAVQVLVVVDAGKQIQQQQGQIHNKTVADGWAGAVMREPLAIQKYFGPTYRPYGRIPN